MEKGRIVVVENMTKKPFGDPPESALFLFNHLAAPFPHPFPRRRRHYVLWSSTMPCQTTLKRTLIRVKPPPRCILQVAHLLLAPAQVATAPKTQRISVAQMETISTVVTLRAMPRQPAHRQLAALAAQTTMLAAEAPLRLTLPPSRAAVDVVLNLAHLVIALLTTVAVT